MAKQIIKTRQARLSKLKKETNNSPIIQGIVFDIRMFKKMLTLEYRPAVFLSDRDFFAIKEYITSEGLNVFSRRMNMRLRDYSVPMRRMLVTKPGPAEFKSKKV